MDQLSIFDALRAPPTIRPVNPHGHVVRCKPRCVFVLPHHRYAFHAGRIELHPSADGLWMWSTSYHTDDGSGGGYRVGEKWGKFASSPDDALHYAIEELKGRLAGIEARDKSVTKILRWATSLSLETGR